MELSICIPTYNRIELLRQFVNQIPEEIPVCISDNGNYIKDFLFTRKNIKIRHIKNVVPPVTNWNSAISLVETEWFLIPGDDDFIFPNMLLSVCNTIKKYADCGLIIYGHDIINGEGDIRKGWCPANERYLKVPDSFYYMQRYIPFRWPSIIINTRRCREIGCLDTEFVCTASDSLFLQHMAIKYPVALIPEVLGLYRIWDGSETSGKILTEAWFSELKLWQEKLEVILKNNNVPSNTKKRRDQVKSDNLIYAFKISTNLSAMNKLLFLWRVGIPYNAGLLDIARILRSII